MDKNNAPVLIAGAGPTGLVLALWLTRAGIAVRIIDKNEQAGQTSRALIVQGRILELYHQLGIAEEVIASGIKMEYFELHKNGKLLQKVDVGEIGTGITPYSFILSFPQDDHERLLIKHLEKLGVEVERNTRLSTITQTQELVTVVLEKNNLQETAQFAWACGCDGARSTVREQLGIQFPGGTYQQKFYVADADSPHAVMRGLKLGITPVDFCLAFPVRSSKTVRLIGIVPAEYQDCLDIQFEQVRTSVERNIPMDVQQVNWFSTYHVHHRVVPRFRVNRIFLAGDAAHIHSPVGGQGMNTGIGDAINLAWKLAGVIQGNYPEKILETYHLERYPFAKKLVSTTDAMFQIVTSTGLAGKIWRSFLFPKVFPFIFRHIPLRQYFFRFISQININYRKSSLSAKNKGKLQGGDRLPWIKMKHDDNFALLKSMNWQVHVYGKARTELISLLEKYAIPLYEFSFSGECSDKGIIENAAYLIRPDGYISAVNDKHIAEICNSYQKSI